MDNPKIWYAVIDGKADGPHEEQTIRQWLTTGKLNYSDLVFRSGLTRWVNVAECKEFERRGTDRVISETVAKFEVPADEGEKQGWIALVKHGEVEGKHHYIQSGPYTSDQIHAKLKKGELKYEDHLWTKGYQNWTPLRTIPEFERRLEIEIEPKPTAVKTPTAPEAKTADGSKKAPAKPETKPEAAFVSVIPQSGKTPVPNETPSTAASPVFSTETKSIAIPQAAPVMFDDDATPVHPLKPATNASPTAAPVVEFVVADFDKSVSRQQTIPTVTLQKMMNDTKMEVTNFERQAGTNTEAIRAGVGLKMPKPGLGNPDAAKGPKIELPEAARLSATGIMRMENLKGETLPAPKEVPKEAPPKEASNETPKVIPVSAAAVPVASMISKMEGPKTEVTKSGLMLPKSSSAIHKIEEPVKSIPMAPQSVSQMSHQPANTQPANTMTGVTNTSSTSNTSSFAYVPAPAHGTPSATPPIPAGQGMGTPLSARDDSAPPPVIPGRDTHAKKKENEPEFVDEILDDVTPVPGNRRRHRLAIAGVCALLAMAMVYAGITAYRETLHKDFLKRSSPTVAAISNTVANRRVASNNGALPDPFADRQQVPVNPEVENPLKPARTLRVVSLKTTTDRPQLVMETDLPGGTQIHIEITARSGAILTYPSFKLVKDIAVQPGSMPSVDLSSDKLQPGDYTVVVRGGGLTGVSPLSVGIHDLTFKKALAAFKKKVAKQQKVEKAEIKDHMFFMAKSYSNLTKTYRAARNPASSQAKAKWNSLIRSWKKEFENKAKDVKALNDRTRNKYAYPDQLTQVKTAEIKLLDVYRQYDRSLKAGREVASDSTAPDQFKQAFRELQRSVKYLK